MRVFRFALAALALLLPRPALAQLAPTFKPGVSISATNPGPVQIMCWSGTDFYQCNPTGGGGGGGGGGDASAYNQTSQITLETAIRDRIGDTSSPASGSLTQLVRALTTQIGTPLQAGGSVSLSGTLPAFAATPTFNIGTAPSLTIGSSALPTGAATAARQDTQTAAITATTGTPGSTAPASGQQVGGVGPSGNLRVFGTGTNGGLIPAQGIVASTRTTLTANSSTLISAQVSTRIAMTVFPEAATTAPIYVCTTQTTSCSATSYDFLIPSGTGAGSTYTPIFATNGTLYAYSTATAVVVVNNWTAQ